MAKKQYFEESELIFEKKPTIHNFKDIEGQVFGRLNVLGYYGSFKKRAIWFCKCDCEKIGIYQGGRLITGHTKSCGCFRNEQTSKANKTHGHTGSGTRSQIYTIWRGIIQRCNDKNSKNYKRYGERGITVCDRWLKFENFLEDMGERPGKEYSLDRKENDKGYYKENCRWATRKEQANNTRRNNVLEFNGVSMNITQWAERLEVDMRVLHNRIYSYGWAIEKTLTTPIRVIKRRA